MHPDFAQRRRVFVAVAITAIAVPAVFLFSRDDSNAETPENTLVGTVPPAGAVAAAPASLPEASAAAAERSNGTLSDVLGTTPTGYLDGTVAPDANDPPMIAVPRPRDTVTGGATFSVDVPNTATCYIPKVPMGVEATVVNLDNSRSVKCEVVAVAAAQPADVMLHPDAFAQIADITEAPVPVEISW
jgi:hypothetical protein